MKRKCRARSPRRPASRPCRSPTRARCPSGTRVGAAAGAGARPGGPHPGRPRRLRCPATRPSIASGSTRSKRPGRRPGGGLRARGAVARLRAVQSAQRNRRPHVVPRRRVARRCPLAGPAGAGGPAPPRVAAAGRSVRRLPADPRRGRRAVRAWSSIASATCSRRRSITLGMYQRAEAILARLAALCGTRHTLVRPSPQFLSQEGQEPPEIASPELARAGHRSTSTARGSACVSPGGHKTGFFCDQRENRRRLAEFCAGRTVLGPLLLHGRLRRAGDAAGPGGRSDRRRSRRRAAAAGPRKRQPQPGPRPLRPGRRLHVHARDARAWAGNTTWSCSIRPSWSARAPSWKRDAKALRPEPAGDAAGASPAG